MAVFLNKTASNIVKLLQGDITKSEAEKVLISIKNALSKLSKGYGGKYPVITEPPLRLYGAGHVKTNILLYEKKMIVNAYKEDRLICHVTYLRGKKDFKWILMGGLNCCTELVSEILELVRLTADKDTIHIKD